MSSVNQEMYLGAEVNNSVVLHNIAYHAQIVLCNKFSIHNDYIHWNTKYHFNVFTLDHGQWRCLWDLCGLFI